jgi:RNA polymerase-interacting CarD/CdnL/TRCF family regulator
MLVKAVQILRSEVALAEKSDEDAAEGTIMKVLAG